MELLTKRRSRIAAGIAVGMLMVPAAAFGKITPASCDNNGGHQPGGQQPSCQGGGLTQNPATNPSGQAPPGQQP